MNSFFQQFKTFALGTWVEDGCLVSRPEPHHTPQSPVNGAHAGVVRQWSSTGLMVAIGLAINSALPLPATATSSAWEQVRAATTNVTDHDVVPANYWAGAIAQLRARPVVNEADYVDIDSLF